MKEKKTFSVLFMAQAAMIAAIYVVVTLVFAPFSYGEVQVRLSEALTILRYSLRLQFQDFLSAVSSAISLADVSFRISFSEVLRLYLAQSSLTCFAIRTSFLHRYLRSYPMY